jgi:uncharacterized protein (TIRG00374 family)
MLKSWGRVGALVAGVGLTAWILWAVGWPAIAANVSAIGPWFFALVGLYLFPQLAFMAGWWVVFHPRLRYSRFLPLFGVYLAGDSVNYLVPSGNMAGEPVKAHLVRDAVGLGHAVASITVHKHAELVAQWMFLVAGTAICLWHFHLPTPVTLAVGGILIFLGGSLLALSWALQRGSLTALLQRVAAWRPVAALVRRHRASLEALDARIATFYRARGRWFAAATAWCLIGWCGGLLESYLVLRLLAPEAAWPTAVAVETLAMTLNSVIAFIPGRLGSAEGVRVGVCMLLGLPAALGVTYGLVRRGRELIWIVPGLVVLLRWHAGRLLRLGFAPSPGGDTPA